MSATSGRYLRPSMKSFETDPPMSRDARLVLVSAGVSLLVFGVLAGAFSQVGEVHCAVCSGNVCTGGTTNCPDTGFLLGFLAASFALGAGLTAFGLMGKRGTLQKHNHGLPRQVFSRHPRAVKFLAIFFLLFGGACVFLGAILPIPSLGNCHEVCVYPYVLSGIPLGLVWCGVLSLAAGFLFVALSLRSRRFSAGASE